MKNYSSRIGEQKPSKSCTSLRNVPAKNLPPNTFIKHRMSDGSGAHVEAILMSTSETPCLFFK
jgi:hypothetical protein